MFPYREDPLGAATESIEFVKQIRNILEGLDESEIEEILKKQDSVLSMRMLRKHFFK